MDLLVCKRGRFIILLLISLSAYALAQEARVGNSENASVMSLDRRTKMFLNAVRRGGEGGDVGLAVDQGGVGLFDAFFASLSMILVSEIGDETFIIAALMAMRHPKSIVLSGALSALIVMTVLSTGLGRIVPNLISRKHTNNAATVLYLFFGLRLLYIAWRSDPKSSQKKEMEESLALYYILRIYHAKSWFQNYFKIDFHGTSDAGPCPQVIEIL